GTLARLVGELREAQRSLEQRLACERDARSLAEDDNRRKDEFLAILSHDLRSPLNSVLTWIEVLRNEAVHAKTRAQTLPSIQRACSRWLQTSSPMRSSSPRVVETCRSSFAASMAKPRSVSPIAGKGFRRSYCRTSSIVFVRVTARLRSDTAASALASRSLDTS